MKVHTQLLIAATLMFTLSCLRVHAQQAPADSSDNTTQASDQEADVAKKLQNPVANLVSVPIRLDWDTGIGTTDAKQATYLVQPVIPISLNQDWNVISRTIVPAFVNLQAPVPGVGDSGGDFDGMGDILQSFFFSPKAPTDSGWIWGAGPAISIPTASNNVFGSGKLSIGPTAVILRQENGWTYGLLANYLRSVAGDGSRGDVSSTFWQPFISYTTSTYTAFGLNTESTYNFETRQWTVPFNATVSQLLKIHGQLISVLVGYRYYATNPTGGANHGFRLQVTLLFPK
jgi:hypothetical protein